MGCGCGAKKSGSSRQVVRKRVPATKSTPSTRTAGRRVVIRRPVR